MYNKRLELLFPKFQTESLVSGLKHIDMTDTATGMAKKVLDCITSIKWEMKCNNEFCEKNKLITIQAATVVSINVYDQEINLEKEIDNVLNVKDICNNCLTTKNTSITLGECFIVEINAMPTGKIL
jgi:hypothetical protein